MGSISAQFDQIYRFMTNESENSWFSHDSQNPKTPLFGLTFYHDFKIWQKFWSICRPEIPFLGPKMRFRPHFCHLNPHFGHLSPHFGHLDLIFPILSSWFFNFSYFDEICSIQRPPSLDWHFLALFGLILTNLSFLGRFEPDMTQIVAYIAPMIITYGPSMLTWCPFGLSICPFCLHFWSVCRHFAIDHPHYIDLAVLSPLLKYEHCHGWRLRCNVDHIIM